MASAAPRSLQLRVPAAFRAALGDRALSDVSAKDAAWLLELAQLAASVGDATATAAVPVLRRNTIGPVALDAALDVRNLDDDCGGYESENDEDARVVSSSAPAPAPVPQRASSATPERDPSLGAVAQSKQLQALERALLVRRAPRASDAAAPTASASSFAEAIATELQELHAGAAALRAALARDKRSVNAVEDAVDANSLALDAANARLDKLLAASWKHPCAIFSLLGMAAMAFLAAYASIRFFPRPPLRTAVRPVRASPARSAVPPYTKFHAPDAEAVNSVSVNTEL
jgi:hypothetical protein